MTAHPVDLAEIRTGDSLIIADAHGNRLTVPVLSATGRDAVAIVVEIFGSPFRVATANRNNTLHPVPGVHIIAHQPTLWGTP